MALYHATEPKNRDPLSGVSHEWINAFARAVEAATRHQDKLDALLAYVEEMKEAAYTFGENSKEAVEVALGGVIDAILAAKEAP